MERSKKKKVVFKSGEALIYFGFVLYSEAPYTP